MLDCLQGVLGVSESESLCIIQGLTPEQIAEMRTSKAEPKLFLDEIGLGLDFKALNHIDKTKNLYQLTKDAIATAAKELQADLTLSLNSQYTQDKRNFQGLIGKMAFQKTLNMAGRWQGVRLRSDDFSDSVVTINRIMLIMDRNAAFNLYLYKADYQANNLELVHQWPVNALENQYFTVDMQPLKLWMKEGHEAKDYYLV
ncbi:MAG TPA: hypothetical protein VD794_08965, partial [Flavisolibacter sp.]|nr:hypothetical protein [Flavisolibacter sp.]